MSNAKLFFQNKTLTSNFVRDVLDKKLTIDCTLFSIVKRDIQIL